MLKFGHYCMGFSRGGLEWQGALATSPLPEFGRGLDHDISLHADIFAGNT